VSNMLGPRDQFPNIALKIVGGETLNLPADISTPYAIVLFYRGHW